MAYLNLSRLLFLTPQASDLILCHESLEGLYYQRMTSWPSLYLCELAGLTDYGSPPVDPGSFVKLFSRQASIRAHVNELLEPVTYLGSHRVGPRQC